MHTAARLPLVFTLFLFCSAEDCNININNNNNGGDVCANLDDVCPALSCPNGNVIVRGCAICECADDNNGRRGCFDDNDCRRDQFCAFLGSDEPQPEPAPAPPPRDNNGDDDSRSNDDVAEPPPEDPPLGPVPPLPEGVCLDIDRGDRCINDEDCGRGFFCDTRSGSSPGNSGSANDRADPAPEAPEGVCRPVAQCFDDSDCRRGQVCRVPTAPNALVAPGGVCVDEDQPVGCATIRCATGFSCIDLPDGSGQCVADDNRCMGDNECREGQHCNAADVCLSPCSDRDENCLTVCLGFCVDDNDDRRCQADSDCPRDSFCDFDGNNGGGAPSDCFAPDENGQCDAARPAPPRDGVCRVRDDSDCGPNTCLPGQVCRGDNTNQAVCVAEFGTCISDADVQTSSPALHTVPSSQSAKTSARRRRAATPTSPASTCAAASASVLLASSQQISNVTRNESAAYAALSSFGHTPFVRLYASLLVLVVSGCDCGEPLADLDPDIDTSPRVLDMGAVRTRVVHAPTIMVGNRGAGSLTLFNVEVSGAPGTWGVASHPTSVAPQDAQPIVLAVEFSSPGAAEGVLVIDSDDPDEPRVIVPIVVEAGRARLNVAPNPIALGTVNEGQGAARSVSLTNEGLDDLVISAIGLEANSAFSLDSNALGILPRTLLPDETVLVSVALQPNAAMVVNGRALSDVLSVSTNVGDARVPVTATVNLAPQAIAFEQRTRRKSVQASVAELVFIDGSETVDPEGDAFTLSWSIIDRPQSSAAPIIGQGQPVVRFSPDVVGRYVVRLRATDVHGAFSFDDVEILPRDLAVVLTWQPAFDASCRQFSAEQCASMSVAEHRQRCCGQSDLDLHLIAPLGVVGDYGVCPVDCAPEHCAERTDDHVDTCRQTGLDCSFSNRHPEWGEPGRDDDPSLDIDDVSGDGPEIITLDKPQEGLYRVVVHYCQDRIGEPTLATITLIDQGQVIHQTAPQRISEGQAWLAAVLTRGASGWTVQAQPNVFESVPADLCAP